MLLLAVLIAGLAWPVYRQTHRRFTYVIVHGAYGGGWGFQQLDELLTADGHKVYRPTLTGQGERVHLTGPNVTLETHIQDVVNVILYEDLHDVVLVGHSYGGMVITGVADRIPDRIKSVIYLDAALPIEGETENTAANSTLHPPLRQTLDAMGAIVPPWLKKPVKTQSRDVPEPAGAFTTPIHLKNQAVAQAIPTTYILYLPDSGIAKNARFYAFYERAIARHWKTRTLISGHNAQWDHPRQLADLLEAAP